MKTSEKIDEISKALAEAQKSVGKALKDASNPFFKSKYADLNSVMGACQPALNENRISVIQGVGFDEQGHFVETRLVHESGQFFSSSMRLLVGKNDMQGLGSAITYARRYAMQAMCFVGADDDDGNANAQQVARKQQVATVENKSIVQKKAIYEQVKSLAGQICSGKTTEEKMDFMEKVLEVSDFKKLINLSMEKLKDHKKELELIILENNND